MGTSRQTYTNWAALGLETQLSQTQLTETILAAIFHEKPR